MANISRSRGRPGTAMPSWGLGGGAQAPLEPQDILDLVAFIRSWQETPEELNGGEAGRSAAVR